MKIREVTLKDSDFLYDLYLKRDSRDILTPIEYEDNENFVKNYLEKSETSPFQSWYVIEVDGIQAGSLTLHKKNNELGYWLFPEFQNKGIGTKAIKEFMDITHKPFYTIRSHIDNKRSQRITEKLGFTLTHYEYQLKNQ